MSELGTEVKGLPQPPKRVPRNAARRAVGLRGPKAGAKPGAKISGPRGARGGGLRAFSGRSRGVSVFGGLALRLLRKLAKAILAPKARSKDFRNHGFTRSGKGGRTGRAGFHGPRGRLW